MRLTDICEVWRTDSQTSWTVKCHLVHKGGDRSSDGVQIRYAEEAAVATNLTEAQAVQIASSDPGKWRVEHHGVEYFVTGVQPRYTTYGRLHHVTIDLRRLAW